MYRRDDVWILSAVRRRPTGAILLFIVYFFQLLYPICYIFACFCLSGTQFLIFIPFVAFISKCFSLPPTSSIFFIIPLLALCLYPFIFLWLLIPTVNKIFHLNTNKAICMTANQYQKSRDGYRVVCNTAMVLMWICAVWVPERGWSVWRSLYVWGILTKENSTLHMLQFYRWSGMDDLL